METELTNLLTKAAGTGLPYHELREIAKLKKSRIQPKYLAAPTPYKKYLIIFAVVSVLIAAGFPKTAYRDPIKYLKNLYKQRIYSSESGCLVNAGQLMFDILRPVVNCGICNNITEVPVIHNITKEYFLKHHAYTGVPVLIKGGASHWSALKRFSFKYFKKLYSKSDLLDQFDEKECQFFGYKTNFRTLGDVFKMSKKRQALKKDQWYIGWSNCIEEVQNELRKHYTRPEFLPSDSESSSLDWLFMGGSGTGALMHIDSVNRPSWQAMITGKKTWFIEPPPECESQCPRNLHATMEPGDILVIDTNKWYHSTFIHRGDLAITIGSEYD